MSITKEEIQAMSAKERSDLLATLWDVIEDDPDIDDLDAESKEELNLLQESVEEYKRNPSKAKEWNEIFIELKNRKK